jgi:hypothetical protein
MTDITKLLTAQLVKFTTLNRHQLAGQVANLEFWIAEARHCLAVIDGYGQRFERMKAAQQEYVVQHQTKQFPPDDPSDPWPQPALPPLPPRRIRDSELKQARDELCDAAYRFLVRSHNDGFIDEASLQRECDRLGVGIERSDLRRGS